MKNTALVVIDIQNDITKHYKDIIVNLNRAVAWAGEQGLHIVYFKHYNLSPGTRTFKPGTKGAELAPDLNVVTDNIFEKTQGSALTSEAFVKFIDDNGITDFILTGADATACVKATGYNMCKAGYRVTVLCDCVTSYDVSKIPEMLEYYKKKGCEVMTLDACIAAHNE